AQLAAAHAGLSSAAAHERRIRALVSQAAATRSELEQAEAQRAQAEAGVRTAEEALRYTELRAPFAGRVQAKRVTAGDLVTPGAPLVELEGRGLELVATLPEVAVGQLKVGQALAFETGEQKGKAELSTIAPSADPVTHRVEVRARVVEAPGLRAGSFARLVLPDGAATAAAGELWVPTSALVQRGDLKGVFVAEEGSAALRWLQLGDPVGDSVPVRAGLAASDEIIDTPGELQDGQPIEVTRAQ
ncbi:MAG TPA: efflux RND transporter periplasmic adaptor subunit, partial [Aggregicoccus sp.]|nr:efflux RND transporter periplasmic adaptor subunit [Aggregicoccus sp.]